MLLTLTNLKIGNVQVGTEELSLENPTAVLNVVTVAVMLL
jgi:hypothetical protein